MALNIQDCMLSELVSLAAIIWVVTAAKQTMENKDNKNKRLVFKYHVAEILWTLALECGPSSVKIVNELCKEFKFS